MMRTVWAVVVCLFLQKGASGFVMKPLSTRNADSLLVPDSRGGFSFSIAANDEHIIAGTPGFGEQEASVVLLSASDPHVVLKEASIAKSKGHIISGCVTRVNGISYFFGGLSEIGSVLRLDLSFPTDTPAIVYLNATDSAQLWNNGPPQQILSAVCVGEKVLFGTRASDSAPATILQLDAADAHPGSRFRSLGPIAVGDLSQGSVWDSNAVLFAMEPSTNIALTFFLINTTSLVPEIQSTSTAPGSLSNFESLSSLVADPASQRAIISNANGVGHVAVLDLSQSTAVVEQTLVFGDVVATPIVAMLVDPSARYAYAVVGDCESTPVFVTIRLVPILTRESVTALDPAKYVCLVDGVASSITMLGSSQTDRKAVVYTESEYEPSKSVGSGAALIFDLFPATPCPNDCAESLGHGQCAGGKCYCALAWSGEACDVEVPCGGTQCNNHGSCGSDGQCLCNKGYKGDFCETAKTCPTECNGRGTCLLGECTCVDGFAGNACQHRTVGCEALSDCNNHGLCVLGYPSGSCSCYPGYTGMDCSMIDTGCVNNCSSNGQCSQGVCMCHPGWTGRGCDEAVLQCPRNCSDMGICSHGRCTCYHGRAGMDCSIIEYPACPAACPEHGRCVEGVCECVPTFSGDDCATPVPSKLASLTSSTLDPSEDRAVSSFAVDDSELLVCVGAGPTRCVVLDGTSLARKRDASFVAPPTQMLLEDSEGVEKTALIPEIGSAVSSVSLVEVASSASVPGVTVGVLDASRTFSILGTGVESGSAVGELFKVALPSLDQVSQVSFPTDTGRGVTAGCEVGDGTFFFAVGTPANIYRVTSELGVQSRTAGPNGEVKLLLFDGLRYLVAVTDSTAFFYNVNGTSVTPLEDLPQLDLGEPVSCGFVERVNGTVSAFLGTSSSPASVIQLNLGPHLPAIQKRITLRHGEDNIMSVTHHSGEAYFGLAALKDYSLCVVVKVSLLPLAELDAVSISNCSGNLISAAVSSGGHIGYFGTDSAPASVYTVKLKEKCVDNCNGRGECVDNECRCTGGWSGVACQITPPCPRNCSKAGVCQNGICQCNKGKMGVDCALRSPCASTCEHGVCSGRNHTLWPCTCDVEWGGEFCDTAVLPCPANCLSRGSCVDGVCICDVGYTGSDCSHVVCATDSECSDDQMCDAKVCKPDTRTPMDISPILIGIAVAVAVLLGLVAAVFVWKSWARKVQMPDISAHTESLLPKKLFGNDLEEGPTRSQVGAGNGYSRIPRRLVK